MLCQFTFKNFKSYRDETIFDMQAANIQEFSNSLIGTAYKPFPPLLPVSVIYGPNAGGKSGLLEALTYFISRVTIPLESSSRRTKNYLFMYLDEYFPFMFDETSSNSPTEFEIFFRTSGAEYRYCLSQQGDKILSESLYRAKLTQERRRPVMLFERTANAISLGSALKGKRVNSDVQDINSTLPYLSFLSINYRFPVIEEAVDWFHHCLSINYAKKGRDLNVLFFPDSDVKQLIFQSLHDMDISIDDYEKEEFESSKGKQQQIYTIHKVGGHSYRLPLEEESQGTIKIFSFLPSLAMSLIGGYPLIVDEMDAKIHPKLLRYLISQYTNPKTNPRGAQLIFTSHDLSTMKNDLLRRDEIWFAAKDEDSASELWSLYELRDETGARIKSTAAYDKQYLEGRYGADPYLQTMLDWRLPDES